MKFIVVLTIVGSVLFCVLYSIEREARAQSEGTDCLQILGSNLH